MTGDGEVLLEVASVSLSFGALQVLENVNFEIRDRVRPGKTTGQIVGVLGPSGVGKTQLFRIIAGLNRGESGTVRGPKGAALVPGRVGFVFQDYPLLEHRTVLSNLVVAGVANGMSRADSHDKATELLERFKLTGWEKHFPAQLSGGQRQRVAIAQQLVSHMPILLMDEPFSGLDPVSLDEVILLIDEVAHTDEHNTVMLVTHDIRAALEVSDTLLMLGRDRDDQGRIVSGARIQRRVDLVKKGLAWRHGIEFDPTFLSLEKELKAEFAKL
jgi:NitT/TauT family transport system ATP-binding protein